MGVRCKWERRCILSQRFTAGVLWVTCLSTIRWRSRPVGAMTDQLKKAQALSMRVALWQAGLCTVKGLNLALFSIRRLLGGD